LVLVLWGRAAWEPEVPLGTLVEVTGDVEKPGLYVVPDARAKTALSLAGGPAFSGDDLAPSRIQVQGQQWKAQPPSQPLLWAEPLDLNTADVASLLVIPGLGHRAAESIVRDRSEKGNFNGEGVERVSGVGDRTLEALSPYVRPITKEPKIVHINQATAAQLTSLPGIGPAIAERIVADRRERGPFRSVNDLGRVKGIGPKKLSKLRPYVRVEDAG